MDKQIQDTCDKCDVEMKFKCTKCEHNKDLEKSLLYIYGLNVY